MDFMGGFEAGLANLAAFIRRERIILNARHGTHSGNSTTAQQLIEVGLAGGAIGGIAKGRDPWSGLHGFGAGATLALGARAGAGKLIGYVDQNVARRGRRTPRQ
jgi:hypothetical protein